MAARREGGVWVNSSGESAAIALNADGTAIGAGDVASGAADSGNPIKVGGKYNVTPPSLDDGDRAELQFDSAGNLKVVTSAAGVVATASLTALASAATSAQLLAANTARQGLLLANTDANAVYVKYGTTASATSFTVLIAAGGYWEMPQPIYTGRIDALWAADGVGSLYATEL